MANLANSDPAASQQPAATPHVGLPLPYRADWLARYHEPALDPEVPIVDPHHHLWHRPDWRYLFDELIEDVSSGHRVVATVFVECRQMYRAEGPVPLRPVGETEFAAGCAAMSESGRYGPARVCRGIVAHADLLLGARVQPVLQAHLAAAGGRLRGIRHSTAWDPDPFVQNPELGARPDLLADPAFRAGFAQLAPLGLSYDAWLYQPQIDQLRELASRHPDTSIVLNHAGGPIGIGTYAGRRDAAYREWLASIQALAHCPNVSVKLGGLAMRISGTPFHTWPAPPNSEQLADALRRFVAPCIDAFGAERCMFESNFPVEKASCSYTVLWNAFKRLAQPYGAAERAALLHDTAARIYRLALPSTAPSGSPAAPTQVPR